MYEILLKFIEGHSVRNDSHRDRWWHIAMILEFWRLGKSIVASSYSYVVNLWIQKPKRRKEIEKKKLTKSS